jgi:hypothetical protein
MSPFGHPYWLERLAPKNLLDEPGESGSALASQPFVDRGSRVDWENETSLVPPLDRHPPSSGLAVEGVLPFVLFRSRPGFVSRRPA